MKGRGINESSLIELGRKRLGKNKKRDQYLESGLKNAYVDFKNAKDVIDANYGLFCLHYDKANGLNKLDSIKNSQLKIDIHKCCNIFDITNIETIEKSLKHKDVLRYVGKQTAAVVTSDAHNVNEIGRNFCWIKAKPCFEGLRQILFEPESRVCFDELPPKYIYPKIQSLSLEYQGGNNYCFKNLDKKIYFSSNLNSIIGPRGTGKSTLVELLSFIYNKHTLEPIRGERTSIMYSTLKIT